MAATERPVVRPSRRFSLLVADREQSFRNRLRALFRNEGYETHLAADDGEAVRIVHRERIDVVILEYELPHIGGLDALRAIKRLVNALMPCVFTAEEVSGRVQLGALWEDAFAVVPKPIDEAVMKRVVRSALRRYYPGQCGPGRVEESEQDP